MNLPAESHPRQLLIPANHKPQTDWQILGDSFEAMGKVGLAMTVGFTVAAAFCKLIDSGRVKLPKAENLVQLVLDKETEVSLAARPAQPKT